MALSVGIVGLPNVGKSTLFNALTNAKVAAENFPFCTIDANEGIVPLIDSRVDKLTALFSSKKKTYTTVRFVDIAGLVKGAAEGEGLGNKFLSHIRETDAIVQVVRLFSDENVTHTTGSVNPISDIEIINTELILKDMESLSARKQKNERALKSGKNKEALAENEAIEKCEKALNDGNLLNTLDLSDEEKAILKPLFLITSKPMLVAANVSEDEIGSPQKNSHYESLCQYASQNNMEVIPFSAKIEAELRELGEEERAEYCDTLGIEKPGIDRLAEAGYKLLNLITFLTAGDSESRAWTVRQGAKAPEAAGVIHSDFERGFISAEVIDYESLINSSSYPKAKEQGLVRLEGKEYVVKDGDVIIFRFNV